MSESGSTSSGGASGGCGCLPFLIIFVLVKSLGVLLVAWSWWWLLFPIVPVIYVGLKLIGAVS